MTITKPAALTIDTLDFRKLLADLIDASGRGDDEYMPVRMKFIAHIGAKLTAAAPAVAGDVKTWQERRDTDRVQLRDGGHADRGLPIAQYMEAEIADLRVQLAAQEPAPATQQGDETIQRLAELHFYAPDADSMNIRLHRFARAVLANAAATQQTEPVASDKHLPGWDRGIATVTMNGHQLRQALEFINPDGPADELQAEDDLTFGIVKHKDDDGNEATGLCCWNADSDGVLPLDSEWAPCEPPSISVAHVSASPAAPTDLRATLIAAFKEGARHGASGGGTDCEADSAVDKLLSGLAAPAAPEQTEGK